MKLICKREALDEKGNKVMEFTKGVVYDFRESRDPEGYEVLDDNGNAEVFFDTEYMFKQL